MEDNKEEIILILVKDENLYVYLDDKKVFEDKESICTRPVGQPQDDAHD